MRMMMMMTDDDYEKEKEGKEEEEIKDEDGFHVTRKMRRMATRITRIRKRTNLIRFRVWRGW